MKKEGTSHCKDETLKKLQGQNSKMDIFAGKKRIFNPFLFYILLLGREGKGEEFRREAEPIVLNCFSFFAKHSFFYLLIWDLGSVSHQKEGLIYLKLAGVSFSLIIFFWDNGFGRRDANFVGRGFFWHPLTSNFKVKV